MGKKTVLSLTITGLFIGLVSLAVWFWRGWSAQPMYHADVIDALSTKENIDDFERALKPKAFGFPEDWGPHPNFQTEWWYYTGNLDDERGRHFGYQLTFFRRALKKGQPQRTSQWSTHQVYFAHFAVTDVEKRQFNSFERFSRGAVGLAGAEASPYRVWLDNWRVGKKGEGVILEAAEGPVSLKLHLKPLKPVVYQGDRGLSQKGSEPGNASYYYSQTRLHSEGVIVIDDTEFEVSGFSWLDREWSTSVLQKGDSGWDWFSIQLEDNREIMVFQIRSNDGSISEYSAGILVAADGSSHYLAKDDFHLSTLDTWESPKSKVSYPTEWLLELPGHSLRLNIKPYIPNQEHRHSFLYWEGAVAVKSDTVTGFGYVELTGYNNDDRSVGN